MNPGASESQIRDYMTRPKRYQNIDGTGELYVGVILGAFAAVLFIASRLPDDSFWRHSAAGKLILFFGVLGAALGLGLWATCVIKKKVTFPRTGYAVQKISGKAAALRVSAGVISGAAVSAVMQFLFDASRRTGAVAVPRVVVFTVFTVSYALVIAFQFKKHPWKMAIVAILAAGLLALAAFAPAAGSQLQYMLPAMLITSAAWLISGAITLLVYIRRTHPPEPEAQ